MPDGNTSYPYRFALGQRESGARRGTGSATAPATVHPIDSLRQHRMSSRTDRSIAVPQKLTTGVRHTAACRRVRCSSSNDEQTRRLNGDGTGSARSSGGSLPCGPARAYRCVRSSNGAHTALRWAKPEQPCWPPPPSWVVPPAWSASRRRPTQLTFRCTGPLASPAGLLPCSSCIHPRNSRRTRPQPLSGAAPTTGSLPSGCSVAGS